MEELVGARLVYVGEFVGSGVGEGESSSWGYEVSGVRDGFDEVVAF